jgi:hypothetical protein
MIRALLFSFLLSSHPVHESIASIEYVSAKKAFDVFVKIGHDDFISDYNITFPGELPSENITGFIPNVEQALKYTDGKIGIKAGGKNLSGVIENIDDSNGEIKIYLRYSYKGNENSFTIRNSIMSDLYTDQTNMLIFKYKETEEGVKFTSDLREQTFNLK